MTRRQDVPDGVQFPLLINRYTRLVVALGLTGTFGAPLYTAMSIAGVTGEDVVTGAVRALQVTMRPCPMGLEASWRCGRRVARHDMVTGSGLGPDGSSLTVDYQRSWGCGAKESAGPPAPIRAATSLA